MTNAVADTHSLIWYLEDDPRLSPAAREAFDDCDRGESTIYQLKLPLAAEFFVPGTTVWLNEGKPGELG